MIAAVRHSEIEQTRAVSDQDRRHELGQFFTPHPVADFMASLFESHWQELDLLDAGAGDGALTAALIRRLCASHHKPSRISVTAFEFDKMLIESLHGTLFGCKLECEHAGIEFSATVLNEDFIAAAVPMVRDELFVSCQPRFNAAIVNPPYRKIRSDSATRLLLRSAGIETGNLYTAHSRLRQSASSQRLERN
jgi:adenine-specific DNA-methyltransferase